jgi:hypothetical protein
MTHADVRERMELATLEPEGLDRLMAGDTLEAAAIATHLAGCPACLEELGRLRRTAQLVRSGLGAGSGDELEAIGLGDAADAGDAGEGVFDVPALPPALRERTLAYVRELGVRRPVLTLGQAAAMVEAPPLVEPDPRTGDPAPLAPPVSLGVAAAARRRTWLRPAAWATSLAAAVVISVVATSLLLGAGHADETAADLTRLAAWSIDVARAPDARQVALVSPSGAPTAGLLAFVPSTGELVVSAHDLAVVPSGKEYRCWMESGNGRRVVGRMFFAGGIAYWVGRVSGLTAVAPGTRFGITLVDAGGSSIDGDPVLLGTL